MPRFIPYAALPLGMLLLTLRFAQLGWSVLTGQSDTIIASHEVEELLAEVTPEDQR
jgi:C4-dicarboxylate transporter DctQ subunit